MKTNSLVYAIVAAAVLSACGTGTNQNPLSNYPKSQMLEPRDGTIQAQGPDIRWKTKIEQQIVEKNVYVTQVVPDSFFAASVPTQFQFVVGKPTTVPVRIRGMVGQLKYEVAIESATLTRLKLENIKVEGNDTTADVTFTASNSDLLPGQQVGYGTLSFKVTLLEVKDANADAEKTLRELAKTKGVQTFERGYVVLPAGSTAAALQGAIP